MYYPLCTCNNRSHTKFSFGKEKKNYSKEKKFFVFLFSPILLFYFFFSLSFVGQVYNLLFYTHTQNSPFHNVQYR